MLAVPLEHAEIDPRLPCGGARDVNDELGDELGIAVQPYQETMQG